MNDFIDKVKDFIIEHIFRYKWLAFILAIALNILSVQNKAMVNEFFAQHISNISSLLFVNELLTILCILVYFIYSFKRLSVLMADFDWIKEIRLLESNEIFKVLTVIFLFKYIATILTYVLTSQSFFNSFFEGYNDFFYPIFITLSGLRLITYILKKCNCLGVN